MFIKQSLLIACLLTSGSAFAASATIVQFATRNPLSTVFLGSGALKIAIDVNKKRDLDEARRDITEFLLGSIIWIKCFCE